MMQVRLVTVGKLKEQYLREACAEYAKRIGRFAKLQILELEEARLPENPGEKEIAQALEAEASAIEKACAGYVIALCIEGKQQKSQAFAGLLTLVIGSSFGLAERIKRRADLRLSMSEMTFPHQLARVMLLEQLYRAFQIQAGGKYHK
ncbi:23S rRNA (pseudouridine(1915)-N(3))-methyltransferase RlmH [Ruminococcus champanellensis]|uniref:23S rRNA (pseudouridine(1915)-N(3))-methyltransferase RlmH n=1 Tax=Ruminococcus champanellensis TaxID=1161942 RepID=UPI0026DC2F90|nr:23S rRNA (pseudouridine(1915)-N(3))-methyltransferase RlmH [Ruminococcus champanellensis]